MKAFKYALAALALLAAVSTYADTLDPTQSGTLPKFAFTLATSGAPDYQNPGGYLDHSCGWWSPVQYGAPIENADGTVTAAFKFLTSCSTGGRGTQPRRFESCWEVTFSSGVVVDRQLLLYVSWKQGQPAVSCPAS